MARVLLVEDDPDIRGTVSELLEDEGHQVTIASNGLEAMSALARMERPCVILLDLTMPVMDGWKVLDALRQDVHLAPIPVVITSAVPDETVVGKAKAIVRKPYALDQLLAVVEAVTASPMTGALHMEQ